MYCMVLCIWQECYLSSHTFLSLSNPLNHQSSAELRETALFLGMFQMAPYWHPIPYIVRYFWWKVVHYIRKRIPFGTYPWFVFHGTVIVVFSSLSVFSSISFCFLPLLWWAYNCRWRTSHWDNTYLSSLRGVCGEHWAWFMHFYLFGLAQRVNINMRPNVAPYSLWCNTFEKGCDHHFFFLNV